jgi:putative nucleotidyltransferase with HDIG domain
MNIHEKVQWLQLTFPKLWADMENCTHHYDQSHLNMWHIEGKVSTHTLMVAKVAELFNEGDVIQWAALLHDLGKPMARFEIPDKERARFVQHEPISVFLAIDVLNKTDLSTEDKINVLKTVGGHSLLFDHVEFIDGQSILNDKVHEVFQGDRTLLELVGRMTRCDTLGRFAIGPDSRTSMGHTIVAAVEKVLPQFTDAGYVESDKPKLTILCGLPASGKSSYVESLDYSTHVISRDNILQRYAETLGITYDEAFHLQETNAGFNREINELLDVQVQEAREAHANVVIDMTNLSKKSRRKWLNRFNTSKRNQPYQKECILFLTGHEELKRRNTIRSKYGKTIPESVYLHMMKSFNYPLYSEGFDRIECRLFEG